MQWYTDMYVGRTLMHIKKKKKKKAVENSLGTDYRPGMGVHIFNPNIYGTEAEISLSLKLTWSTESPRPSRATQRQATLSFKK